MRGRKTLHAYIVVVSVTTIIVAAPSSRMRAASEADIRIVGTYAQLRQTAEHVYGYELQLFRDGGSLVGLWSRADGEPGDFPLLRVGDLRWNESSGALHFTARWCDNIEIFDGVLTPKSVSGTVMLGPKAGAAAKKVELLRVRDEWPSTNRAEWASLVEKMLKRRGPKC